MVEIETVEDENAPFPGDKEWKPLMGEDLVMKVIKTDRPRNNKDPTPVQPSDAVMIDFVARVADNRLSIGGPMVQEVKDWFILVGDGDVLPALELAIRFMDSGSTARVWSHSKYAFSSGTRKHGKTQLASNTNIMFEITVTQIVVDTSRLNPYFTIQKAVSRKAIANDIYQNEWCPVPTSEQEPSCDAAMARALRLYKKAAQEMETLLGGTYFNQVEEDHPQRLQATQIMLDSLNNIVAVYLRQKQYHDAKQSAVEVLKQDAKNIKANSEITYKHPQEEKELKRIKTQYMRKQQDYKKKTKEMFSNKLNNQDLSDVQGIRDSSLLNVALKKEEQGSTSNADDKRNIGDKRIREIQERKPFWKSTIFAAFVQVILLSLFLVYWFFKEPSLDGKSPMMVSTDDPDDSRSSSESNLDL
ncbi:unnamed protein product [Cylindrotheca closterium]|uniref:peptidylprolyl isomerase n=1 Tax=Cylindrotheca closterium TaxID=2856 RepID=A0AAD2FMK6_9STRA|nr:unnamed protein product [Cylindrotheca closterium]